jgi:hypothetical protein
MSLPLARIKAAAARVQSVLAPGVRSIPAPSLEEYKLAAVADTLDRLVTSYEELLRAHAKTAAEVSALRSAVKQAQLGVIDVSEILADGDDSVLPSTRPSGEVLVDE